MRNGSPSLNGNLLIHAPAWPFLAYSNPDSYLPRQKGYEGVRWLNHLIKSYPAKAEGYESFSCQTHIDPLTENYPQSARGSFKRDSKWMCTIWLEIGKQENKEPANTGGHKWDGSWYIYKRRPLSIDPCSVPPACRTHCSYRSRFSARSYHPWSRCLGMLSRAELRAWLQGLSRWVVGPGRWLLS